MEGMSVAEEPLLDEVYRCISVERLNCLVGTPVDDMQHSPTGCMLCNDGSPLLNFLRASARVSVCGECVHVQLGAWVRGSVRTRVFFDRAGEGEGGEGAAHNFAPNLTGHHTARDLRHSPHHGTL